MATYLVIIIVFSYIGGADTERIAYWGFPVVFILAGKILDEIDLNKANMKKLITLKLLVFTLCFYLSSLQLFSQTDAHYWTHQFGAKGLLLNGAVIASTEDETAVFTRMLEEAKFKKEAALEASIDALYGRERDDEGNIVAPQKSNDRDKELKKIIKPTILVYKKQSFSHFHVLQLL